MNLYTYIEERANIERVSEFKGDKYELTIVRIILKELASIFYRDYTFFLYKENLIDRDAIYNKKFDLSNLQEFSIVCKSYCEIVKEILKVKYDIDSELISPFSDRYRHVDLIIKTKKGNKYIVDPLTDLIEMQVGMRTNNFGSKNYYENMYSGKLDNISFLTDEEIEEIDDKINYNKDNFYLDDFLQYIKEKLDNIEDLLINNEKLSIDLLGYVYDGRKLSENEVTNLKLRFICKYLNNRKNLNGIVDLMMFSKIVTSIIFSDDEQQKIKICSFFVDEKDLINDNLINLFNNDETRKRGIVINCNNYNFIVCLGSGYLEFDDATWKNTIEENKIFVKEKYPVQLLKYLKSNGADRNILHNNEFLRLFCEFERNLMRRNKSLEDIIKENVFIFNGMIYTIDGSSRTLYKLENGNLVFLEYDKNLKHTVFYQDEGRNVFYESGEIFSKSERDD